MKVEQGQLRRWQSADELEDELFIVLGPSKILRPHNAKWSVLLGGEVEEFFETNITRGSEVVSEAG